MELTPIQKSINIAYQPHPVAPLADRKLLVAEIDGMTSVRRVLLMSGIDPHQPITVQLDGQLLTVKEWDSVYPSEGQLLSVHATVQGGGGDGSNVVMIVAMIAIMVAAPYVGAAFAASTGAVAGTTAFATTAALGSAIFSIAGSLVIGAIFAPKPPSAPNTTATTVSPTYSLSGGSNRARPYEPMPVVFGTHRMFFDYGARPYTEYQGNDQYLYQIFNNSLGLVLADDFKIGTTPLNSYVGWSISASDANGKLLEFPGNVDTLVGGQLITENQVIERTSSSNVYTLGLDFEAILFNAANNGTLQQMELQIFIHYRVNGTSTYQQALPSEVRVVGDNAEYITAPSNYYLEIRGSSQKPNRVTLFIEGLSPNTYDVRVTRVTREAIGTREQLNLNWSVLRSYQQDDSDYKGQNRIGLIIKATEQLSGSVQQLSAQVTAQATYWNGTAWVTGVTSNPAHWFMHFARGVYNSDNKLMYGVGLTDSQIDYAGLHVWAQFCNTEGLTFNAVLDSTQTAADMLNSIATCGFASPSWASGKLGAIFDTPNASPVMAFGMSNIIRDTFQVAYISENLAEELVISFSNPDKNYEQDQVRTLVPNVVNPLRSSSINLYGCTNATMAGKFANYLAAQQYYRRRRVTWQSDFEGFVCQRGDVVLLSHDLTQWGYSGRFVSTASNVVTLDRTVPRQNQVEYLMLIRPDGTTTTYDVQATTSTESDTLTIINDTIVFQSGANLIDHRWTFSPLETVGKKLKILSVQPASDARLTIVATDESEEFYTAWGGTFTPPRTDTILPAVIVAISNLTASNRVAFVNGYLTNRVALSWGVTGSVLYSRVKIFLDGNLIREVTESVIPYEEIDINGAGTFYAEVTPFGVTGAGVTQTTTLSLSALGFPSPPTSVTLVSGEGDKAATFEWTPVLGVQSYVIEIVSAGAVKRSVNVGNTLSYTYTIEEAQADGGAFRAYTFRVYSVNQTGQSTTFASANFNNPQIGQLQNASIDPMPNSLWFEADRPSVSDYAGILIWISKTAGFTPTNAELIYEGDITDVTLSAYTDGQPLESGVVYYVRVAAYDTFGKDNLTLTGQLSATILSPAWGLLEGDIERSVLESGLRDEIEDGTTQITNIQNKYTVKINDSGHISGYGLISTANNATPFSEFIVVADRFAIAPVATNPTAVDGSPFFVLTSPTVIDGVSIPAGTYMKKAFIHDASITTAKIENLAVNNAKIADLSVTTAKIADANITNAKIGDAQITNAKIGSLAVDTLKIAGNSVTVSSVYQSIGDTQVGTSLVTVLSGTLTVSGFQPVYVMVSAFAGGAFSGTPNATDVDISGFVSIGATSITVVPNLTVKSNNLSNSSGAALFTGLTAGTYTIALKFITNNTPGHFIRDPKIIVIETKR